MDCTNHLVLLQTPKEKRGEPLRMSCSVSVPYRLPGHSLFNTSHKAEKISLGKASTILRKMATPTGEFWNIHSNHILWFWDNCRLTRSCRRKYRAIPYNLYSASSTGSILQNYRALARPGYWHQWSQVTEHLHHHKALSCYPFISLAGR